MADHKHKGPRECERNENSIGRLLFLYFFFSFTKIVVHFDWISEVTGLKKRGKRTCRLRINGLEERG